MKIFRNTPMAMVHAHRETNLMKVENTRLIGWIKYILLILVSCFFLFFGIQVLLAAYDLKDPFTFLMTFFASNFMILISATFVVVFVMRIRSLSRPHSSREAAAAEKSESAE